MSLEQYPATKDEWADPIESDDVDMKVLRPFLKNTNLETRALQLTYDANRDGWDPISFHNAVDKKGGAIVMCVTRMGVVCGGYNPKGKSFSSYCSVFNIRYSVPKTNSNKSTTGILSL